MEKIALRYLFFFLGVYHIIPTRAAELSVLPIRLLRVNINGYYLSTYDFRPSTCLTGLGKHAWHRESSSVTVNCIKSLRLACKLLRFPCWKAVMRKRMTSRAYWYFTLWIGSTLHLEDLSSKNLRCFAPISLRPTKMIRRNLVHFRNAGDNNHPPTRCHSREGSTANHGTLLVRAMSKHYNGHVHRRQDHAHRHYSVKRT